MSVALNAQPLTLYIIGTNYCCL